MKSQAEVDALAEHIREEVQRHRDRTARPAAGSEPASAKPETPRPQPAAASPAGSYAPVDTLLAQVGQFIARAQSKNEVGAGVPKIFRPFYRNQGGYNVVMLKAVESLRDANYQLAAENERLRESLATQTARMKRLAQGMEATQERIAKLEAQNDHDQRWLHTLQSHAEGQSGETEQLRQQLRGDTQETRQGIDRFTEHLKRVEHSLSRLDDRQMSDASFLKHQFWLAQPRTAAVSATGQEEQKAEGSADSVPGTDGAEQDALYVAFEDVFRGSRRDIKERLEYYLPSLRDAQVGTPEKPVLDLGCGRGEWLELLGEQGMTVTGVDLNSCMIEVCRERGLPGIRADGLAHLAALPAESVGAVTAFHLIEHLPPPALLRFFRECRRVLKPGGLAIFETPNPYNLVVGAARFYDDHTHERPLPPNSTRFLVEQAGFKKADILPLHPREDAEKVHGDGTNPELVERFNELFYGPQDYAIIASVAA